MPTPSHRSSGRRPRKGKRSQTSDSHQQAQPSTTGVFGLWPEPNFQTWARLGEVWCPLTPCFQRVTVPFGLSSDKLYDHSTAHWPSSLDDDVCVTSESPCATFCSFVGALFADAIEVSLLRDLRSRVHVPWVVNSWYHVAGSQPVQYPCTVSASVTGIRASTSWIPCRSRPREILTRHATSDPTPLPPLVTVRAGT